jgi:hypothetical protein
MPSKPSQGATRPPRLRAEIKDIKLLTHSVAFKKRTNACNSSLHVSSQAAQSLSGLYILNIYTEYLTVIKFSNEMIKKI